MFVSDMLSKAVHSGKCWFLITALANKLYVCVILVQMKVGKSISDTRVI